MGNKCTLFLKKLVSENKKETMEIQGFKETVGDISKFTNLPWAI